MPDSALIMIPAAYDMPCETSRFAGRNEGFRFGPGGVRDAALQITSGSAATKLRKGAGKPMKLLARATLCAGARAASRTRPPDWETADPNRSLGQRENRKWRRKLLKSLKTDSEMARPAS